MGKDLQ